MPVGMHTVNVRGVAYQYDPVALEEALRQKGLSGTQAAEALSEVKNGDFARLRELGLQKYVSGTGTADLPPPKQGLSADSDALLASVVGFNMLEVLYALNAAAKEMRTAAREMRHAERDMAQSEALRAADKIRSAALINMIVGVVSGTINIGMGLYSIGSTASQMRAQKNTSTDLKLANNDVKQIKADVKLAESQTKLSQTKVEAAAKQQDVGKIDAQVKATEEVKMAETKVEKLQAELETMQKDTSKTADTIKAKQEEVQLAKEDLAAKRRTLEEMGGPKTAEDLAKARTEAQTAQERVTKLEVEVRDNAAAAKKINSERTSTLEKAVEQKNAEIKKLEQAKSEATKEVGAARDNLTGLPKNATPGEKAKAEARLNKANDNLSALDGELKTAQNSLPGLKTRLNDSKAQDVRYTDPTGDASLSDAKARLDAGNLRHQEAVTQQATAQKAFDRVLARSNSKSAQMQGLNTAVGGVSQAAQGIGGYFAAGEQAEGAEHTAESQKAASMENENADFQKAAEELMASVRNIIKETLQAYNQANSSIYRNM